MSDRDSLSMSVRDYECDLQGVVNNAVYQQYLEHSRHEYLKKQGVDFAACTRAGIHLVVVRAELDYRQSLSSGDRFRVETVMRRQGRLRFAFHQRIVREANGDEEGDEVGDQEEKSVLDAVITGVALNEQGRPFMPEMLTDMLREAT